MAQKGVKRWPIRFAKIRKRLLRRFRRLTLPSAQNKGPMRRLKRSTSLLQRSRHRFRNGAVLPKHLPITIQIPGLGLSHEFLILLASSASKLHRACLELSSYETREVGRIFEAKLIPNFGHGQFRVQEETFGFQKKACSNQLSRRQTGFKSKRFVQTAG